MHYDNTKLAALATLFPRDTLHSRNPSTSSVGEKKLVTTPEAPTTNPEEFARTFQKRLFQAEPSAVLQRMLQNDELSVHEPPVKSGLATFFANLPDFNIRSTSVLTAIQHPRAFDGIAKDDIPGVTQHLKTLQRVQALTPTPEAVPTLLEAGIKSAFDVSNIPKSRFTKRFADKLGEETALQIHTHAVNSRIKQESALTTLLQTLRGSGLQVIDGSTTRAQRLAKLQGSPLFEQPTVNLTQLFGSMDYCDCVDCNSILSPAAYFIELLQYLRNNNTNALPIDTGSYAGTTLELLFRRRPDLANLELTCVNTNTVLPYIDLSNEIMESFVVHLKQYATDNHIPKQATLDTFNVEDEDSALLLSAPQHTNFNAYCIIKDAVYPFTLPYHRGIDEIRILLNYLGTSYSALLDTFRDSYQLPAMPSPTDTELQKLHTIIRNRAVAAEYLGLTLEEYKILTKEVFWPLHYFEITQAKTFTVEEYQTEIGVQPDYAYWGPDSEANGTSMDESAMSGLTFVQSQFLPRSGITYANLVDLLRTQYVNPSYPSGWALTVMESLRFSYRFLMKLVDGSKTDPKAKYAKLIKFLNIFQPLVTLYEQYIAAGNLEKECPEHRQCTCFCHSDYCYWVYKYFEAIGKLIVLDSGEGPTLPLEGWVEVLTTTPPAQTPKISVKLAISGDSSLPSTTTKDVGYLNRDGSITQNGMMVGRITKDSKMVDMSGSSFLSLATFAPATGQTAMIYVMSTDKLHKVAMVNADNQLIPMTIESHERKPVTWGPPMETCDISKVRLVHLDGTCVTATEYDGMQRFLRLWMKLGWTIDQLDKALVGLAAKPSTTASGSKPASNVVGFSDMQDTCGSTNGSGGSSGGSCAIHGTDTPVQPVSLEITPYFISQLVAVQKLLVLTGLPLIKVLAFWAEISTAGDASLYSQLFLTPNLLGVDTVFKPDNNGNYLAQSGIALSDHYPVLMAAFQQKNLSDFISLIQYLSLTDLTLSSITILYRYVLLGQYLGIKVSLWPDVVALFGDPFASAHGTLVFLTIWNRLQATNFTFAQLNYIIRGVDDPLRPIGPSQPTILRTSKTLYDGLTAISAANPDLAAGDTNSATSALVTAKATLVFDPTVVAQILGLLEGTTTYTTNAPVNLTITMPTTLSKLKYTNQPNAVPPQATLQATGILTVAETTTAKALSTNSAWSAAIDRLGKQPSRVFNDVLFGIFPDVSAAKQVLLAGDVLPADTSDASSPQVTPPIKRFFFLQYFLPFLRFTLADKLVVDTMASVSQMPTSDLTRLFLEDILKVGSNSALNILKSLAQSSAQTGSDWVGTLVPPSSDTYTFVAIADTQPQPIVLAGQSMPFVFQQDDPSNVWSTNPVKLIGGTLYPLNVVGQSAAALQWKTARSPPATIPSSSLLPGASTDTTTTVFVEIFKASFLVNGFNLSDVEVSYLQANPSDFSGIDFNSVTLEHWKRLDAYTNLRNGLPTTDTTLIDLFKWAATSSSPASGLVSEIVAATQWDQTSVASLITSAHFNLITLSSFRNEINLIVLKNALAISGSVGVDTDTLFNWSTLPLKFWSSLTIAANIRKTIRSRFVLTDWEQVVQPLNNTIRENQKNALIAYLLSRPEMIKQGIVDADGLFEFFLIDVQMSSCLQTSRIKQAISTVQLFVQRCLLGLEQEDNPVYRPRWESMQSQPLYVARRNVFLYPENWLVASLRDDKSPFYIDFESELLQKDISLQNATAAVKNYLFELDVVGKLQASGLFYDSQNLVLHICARTLHSPYSYWYRKVDTSSGTEVWEPWQQMQTELPNYTIESATGISGASGTYLTPVIYSGRILVFFLQLAKKTQPSTASTTPFSTIGSKSQPNQLTSIQYWEATLCWTEYRDGKWTPKQLASSGVSELAVSPTSPPDPTQWVLPPIDVYQVVPRFTNVSIISDPGQSISELQITFDVYRCDSYYHGLGDPPNTDNSGITNVGRFYFANGRLTAAAPADAPQTMTVTTTSFQYSQNPLRLYSLQEWGTTGVSDVPPLPTSVKNKQFFGAEPYVEYPNQPDQQSQKPQVTIALTNTSNQPQEPFSHDFVHTLLGLLTSTEDLDDLFNFFVTKLQEQDMPAAFGADQTAGYNEQSSPYALYNWELTFHIPMALVNQLRTAQQYDTALKVLQYIFDPYADGTDPSRYWKFRPFQEIVSKDYLEDFLASLQPGVPNSQIKTWRDHPFSPHVIARSRPVAYMKWVVMTYIGILIDYGDYYFRQNTLESVPLAIQCYILADHIYGPAGQKIPKQGNIKVETYASLLSKWDAFENAVVDMELIFPFSNQITTPVPTGWTAGDDFPNIFGFATTHYFCIPDNPTLRGLKATIDDRLFKLRHCQDINGVVRKLALFEPPLDIASLVQAAAEGISISSVLNDLNSSMSNYRFLPLVQKALEMCGELKALGGAYLSAREKGDSESLQLLRQHHESVIAQLVMDVKTAQKDEASATMDGLQQNRLAPVSRLQHYLALIGQDNSAVPAPDVDFTELIATIEAPISNDVGLILSPSEQEEMDKANTAADWLEGIGIAESLAGVLHAFPTVAVNGEPFGVGATVHWGMKFLADATMAVARGLRVISDQYSHQSSMASRKASFQRALQDRILQANNAGYEIKNIDKQIVTQQVRMSIADKEIVNQQKVIDNSAEVETFLKNKYTNEQLYQWLSDQTQTLYYQTYTTAYDLAKRAEQAYYFERPLETGTAFIQFGYWDPTMNGLLAGERLLLGLKQLEAAYQATRGYDFEMSKNVSLRQTNPLALLQLRATASCNFSLPEILFDMDFPGHYNRRIKTIGITIPCVVGPYIGVTATLRLVSHKYRTSAIAKDKDDYVATPDGQDDPVRFMTSNIPINAIATSTCQNDAGVFELLFRDERYMPFEGGGVISQWQLSLPDSFRQFDYNTITDVVVHIHYTSIDGGDNLKAIASGAVLDYIKNVQDISQYLGLFSIFDLQNEFASDWYQAMHPAAGATQRVLNLNNLSDHLPIYTITFKKCTATDIFIFSTTAIQASVFSLVLANPGVGGGGDPVTFTSGPDVGSLKGFSVTGVSLLISSWQLIINDVTTLLDDLWMILRYTLS